MARKGTLHTQIPKFNTGDWYVYFENLNTPTKYTGIDKIKQALYQSAKAYYGSLINELMIQEQPSETIDNAIKFLGNAAARERQKEIRVVESYINNVYKDLPPILKNNNTYNHSGPQQLVDTLKKFSDSFTRGTTGYGTQIDIQHFYQSLTLCLNAIRDDVGEFKRTLTRISDNNRKKMQSLASRSWLYRYESDMEGLFKNLIGIASKQTADSLSSTLRNTIFDYFTDKSNDFMSNVNVREHFPALMAGMLADFEKYLSHNNRTSQLFDQTLSKTIEPKFKDYIEQGNTLFLQRLQDLLSSENKKIDNTFTQALTRFENNLGIKLNDMTVEKQQERDQLLLQQAKDTRSANAKQRNYIRKRMREIGEEAFVKSFRYMTWTPRTSGSHGSIYEAVEDIINNSIHSKGTAATDNVTILGTLHGEIDDRFYDELITNSTLQIANEITHTQVTERLDRFTNTSASLEKVNENINEISNQLSDSLNQLNKIDNDTNQLFIFHESLKLYSSMEWDVDNNGVVSRQSTSFHGREMLALNMLDSLYVLEGIPNLKLPDKNALYGLMLNLNDSSVMKGQEALIENYLAIFAGLLMFSDARNMAIEAARATQNQINAPTQQIHLYLLNGVYMPGSMILTTVHEAIRNAYQTILSSNGISVNITTDKAAAIVNQYVNQRTEGMPYNREDWDDIANQIASTISIKISFLSGFVSFIQALNKQF